MKHFFLVFVCLFIFSCSPDDHFENGEKIIFYPGTKHVKQSVQYKNGRKHGHMKEFYSDGKLKADIVFENDSLNDTTLLYHPNGQLKSLHVYKNKFKHGRWQEFNKEGKLYSDLFFDHGMLDSTCSEYSYRTVKLLHRFRYHKGEKHGVQETFYPKGNLKSREYYYEGQLCKGTEEWAENGKPVSSDFKIFITENDAVLLENKLVYKIRLENPRPDDRVYRVVRPGTDGRIGDMFYLEKEGDTFICSFNVSQGGFVMEEVTIAAFRKTAQGNTVIKTQSFNAASNNF